MRLRPSAIATALLGGLAIVTAARDCPGQIVIPGGITKDSRGSGIFMPGGEETDPEKLLEQRRERAAELLKEGREHLDVDRILLAIRSFKSVIELVGGDPDGVTAFKELLALHEHGLQEVARAEGLYHEGKYTEAIELAEYVRIQYAAVLADVSKGIPLKAQPSSRAAALIRHIERDPAARAAFQQVRSERLMKEIERLDAEPDQEPAQRLRLYKLMKQLIKYNPLCDHAKTCARKLAEMEKDEELMAEIRRQAVLKRARQLYQLAEAYERAGRSDKAEQKYRQILKECPDVTLEQLREADDDNRPDDGASTPAPAKPQSN